jgi:hypothetical protein
MDEVRLCRALAQAVNAEAVTNNRDAEKPSISAEGKGIYLTAAVTLVSLAKALLVAADHLEADEVARLSRFGCRPKSLQTLPLDGQ